MRYMRTGKGDFLVLVHGALADEQMWYPHIEILKNNYEVVAVSQRHFSGPDNGSFGLNTHAYDLAEFIIPLSDEKPVYIAGWSYGADVVLNMLIRHKVDLSGVFLYEPGFPGCLSGNKMEQWASDANNMFAPVFGFLSEGNPEKAVEAMIDGSGRRKGYFMNQPGELKAQQIEKSGTLPLQLNQHEKPDISKESLSDLTVPFTAAYGSETRDIFRLVTMKTAKAVKASRLLVVEGAGHMLPLENPEKFSSIIKEILQD